MRGKLGTEMALALKLKKSDLNLFTRVYAIAAKRKMLFDTIIWIDLLFILLVGWYVHFRRRCIVPCQILTLDVTA